LADAVALDPRSTSATAFGSQRPVMSERILILDDQLDMVENCRRMLSGAGYECLVTTDPNEAISLLESHRPDLLLTDLRMPGMDGMELLRQAVAIDPRRPVIMFSGFATFESAVAAVKEGAFDYLAKPFTLDQLRLAVERAIGQRRLALENLHLKEQLQQTFGFENILGTSSALHRVLEMVRKAARSEASIMLEGESGTGKELIARAIHANSPRASGPFVAVDCASLPENLLESELFGHEKGAFTGAIRTKAGLMELAHRGTLLLDEVAELPASLQVKLLRALQERQHRRVGGTRNIDFDVRVVSATNRNLDELVSRGQFRKDLYYRLNVIPIKVPPLRERRGDVTLLAHAFLKEFGQLDGHIIKGFDPEAVGVLENYPWPGNVRELQNAVEYACALAEGEAITVRDLPEQLWSPQAGKALSEFNSTPALTLREARARWMNQMEASYLSEMIRRHGDNVTKAASAAGTDRKTLRRLLKKHHLR
jgi:DNA-binding NtrC family response regulator